MEFTHEFRVSLPIEAAWELFTDIPRLAPCMPGAQLTAVEGDRYRGTVKVKVGPVTIVYRGVATFEERDDAAHTVRLKASGQDTRGQGNAEAHITARLAPDGEGTRVTAQTRLSITGKAAQFGQGVIEEISKKLLGRFVDCLEQRSDTGPAEATAGPTGPTPTVSVPTVGAPTVGAPTGSAPTADAPASAPTDEPLDLLDVARGALLKRLVPAAAGALIVLALVVGLRRARRSGRCCRRCG
ncbi:SRPBCC domain-containing protein [Kitasatospora sp. NPDC049258]|uniref:SRPBCC family protein n=1 Tax=Kitasatospora sp. NPDC049258 TaxID=3155394 RepID=UPI00341B3A18